MRHSQAPPREHPHILPVRDRYASSCLYKVNFEYKYLNFYTFFETFTETVLKKEMKDLAKLEYLKKSLGGEALDAVRIYSHGDQIPEALKVLQDLYAKQELIVAEIYSNLRNMPTIESF